MLPPSTLITGSPAKLYNNASNSGFIASLPLQALVTVSNAFVVPHFGLNITNRIRLFMVDSATGRLIDCVLLGGLGELGGLDSTNNINQDLTTLDAGTVPGMNPTPLPYQFWSANPGGFQRQVIASENPNATPPSDVWTGVPLPPGTSLSQAATGFNSFMTTQGTGSNQVPIVASRTYYSLNVWSANDPAVHYMVSDLTDPIHTNTLQKYTGGNPITDAIGVAATFRSANNLRYLPWGTNSTDPKLADVKTNQLRIQRISLITMPDNWQFPTNKFPNIG